MLQKSHFKAGTLGNAFLLARHHDTSPHVELLRHLELNLQIGSAIAELSSFVHYTNPQTSFSACFAETCTVTLKEKFFLFAKRKCMLLYFSALWQ